MPKQTTNQLIDTITEVIEAFDWATYGDDELAYAIRGTEAQWVQDMAREIAKAVR